MARLPMMHEEEIAKYVRDHCQPIRSHIEGAMYRASAKLIDGTLLPCVAFVSKKPIVDLAVKRLRETDFDCGVVESFVTKGSCLDFWNIAEILPTRFAIPLDMMRKIRGETAMSWTGFEVRMKDGASFDFGTTFESAFLTCPRVTAATTSLTSPRIVSGKQATTSARSHTLPATWADLRSGPSLREELILVRRVTFSSLNSPCHL